MDIPYSGFNMVSQSDARATSILIVVVPYRLAVRGISFIPVAFLVDNCASVPFTMRSCGFGGFRPCNSAYKK